MKTKLYLMVSAGILALSLVGCGRCKSGAYSTVALGDGLAVGKAGAGAADEAMEEDLPATSSAEPRTAPVLADKPAAPRLLVYRGEITLVVEVTATAIGKVRAVAESAGGFMVSSDGRTIVVRIPVAKFNAVVEQVKALGEVTSEEISALDVSDRVRDEKIRLENAEQMRKRLVALVEKATNVTEALGVERELGRVTEQIELLKGEIAVLQEGSAFSFLTVHVNSPVPQLRTKRSQDVAFPWVGQLGQEVSQGVDAGAFSGTVGSGVKFDIPKGFAKCAEDRDVTWVVSADNVYIKAQRKDNAKGGDVAFWAKLVRRVLLERQAIAMAGDARDIRLEYGVACKVLHGTKETAGGKMGYLIAVAATKHDVYVVEAWGPADALDAARPEFENAVKTMDVQWFCGWMIDAIF